VCCEKFKGGLNGTCPETGFKYPICILPPHLIVADWTACYTPMVHELWYGHNMSFQAHYTCFGSGGRYSAPVVLGLLAVAAVSVVAM